MALVPLKEIPAPRYPVEHPENHEIPHYLHGDIKEYNETKYARRKFVPMTKEARIQRQQQVLFFAKIAHMSSNTSKFKKPIANLNTLMSDHYWTYKLRSAFTPHFNNRVAYAQVSANRALPFMPPEMWAIVWGFLPYEAWPADIFKPYTIIDKHSGRKYECPECHSASGTLLIIPHAHFCQLRIKDLFT
jgi:hypothetical protein